MKKCKREKLRSGFGIPPNSTTIVSMSSSQKTRLAIARQACMHTYGDVVCVSQDRHEKGSGERLLEPSGTYLDIGKGGCAINTAGGRVGICTTRTSRVLIVGLEDP
jgi:hypothetical protein